MSGLLMVPIHLDALVLAQDQMVAGATANFARLPYSDTTQDVNAAVANISEEIVSQPFDDQNLYLKAGIHLHWSLPDALTRGWHTAAGTDFPAVPNRWLVMRSKEADGQMASVERSWVVESDYLFPDDAAEPPGSITVPFAPDAAQGHYRPFRYQGRSLPLQSWQAHDPSAEYVEKLTAIGYGEPLFAAFYPNCLSVFGLYDSDYSTPAAGLCYDVVGWYSDGTQDALSAFLTGFSAGRSQPPTAAELQEAVSNAFGWSLSLPAGQEFPTQTLCYARLTFHPPAGSIANPAKGANVTVAIGNNSTEALSAYLSSRIDSQHKAAIEDELEALHLSYRLENRRLDIGAKFVQTRHETSFLAVGGGTLWLIAPQTDSSAPADAASAQEQAATTLPADLATKLDALNRAQRAYDQAQSRIASLRKQLFSDWYKYMLCTYPPDDARDDYPDSDEVRCYIEQQDMAPLQQVLDTTGQLSLGYDNSGRLAGASATTPNTLAAAVAQAINDLLSTLSTFNSEHLTRTTNVLKPTPAPRYWLPRDPALVLMGAPVTPTERHGQDGLLSCQAFANMAVQDLVPGQLAALKNCIASLEPGALDDFRGLSTWTQQPWNPFLLDWEVEMTPLDPDPEIAGYAADYITRNYVLPQNTPDLSLAAGKGATTNTTYVYSGSSILTPYVQEHLQGHIAAYLADPQLDTTTDTYRHVKAASDLLNAPDFHCLSQSLGGLTAALLMHRQTRQLAIDDPLAFADYATFTQRVSQYVQQESTSAPEPEWDFNPIRGGGLRVLRLRLIDTFGQVQDLTWNGIVATAQMTSPQGLDWAELPPRLAQPARLNLRWLAANDAMEMNASVATAPICGWVLPNNLDGSLLVYDNQGKILGLLNERAQWNSHIPGGPQIEVSAIPNPHLRNMVQYLVKQGESFLANFLATVDSGLANIDPENFAQHQDLALLMGRPVALVRASVDLELRDAPAISQGWNTFRQDLARTSRDSENFLNVAFPIRLGEYEQLNDGLVGYWIETSDGSGYKNDTFYAVQSDPVADPHISTLADDSAPLCQTLADPSTTVSMLIDPRGTVHATCGVLPAKEINIPPDQYTAALQAIEVLFLCTPILTDVGKLNLPLPAEAGYQWSWAGSTQSIGKVNSQATFAAPQEIREGWLQLNEIPGSP